jgi:plastocyanin
MFHFGPSMRAPWIPVILLLASMLFFPASGAAKAPDEAVEISEPAELTAWNYAPASISVPVDTSVVWKNTGRETHSITSQNQLFDSKLLDPDKSWSYTFDTPGVYRYFCVPHPWMKGTVIVIAEDAPRRGDSGASQDSLSSLVQVNPSSILTPADRGGSSEP